MNDHLSGKELFIRFTTCAFRKLLSVYVFSYFPFSFEGRIWDLIVTVSVPDQCLSFYFGDVTNRYLSTVDRIMSDVILSMYNLPRMQGDHFQNIFSELQRNSVSHFDPTHHETHCMTKFTFFRSIYLSKLKKKYS